MFPISVTPAATMDQGDEIFKAILGLGLFIIVFGLLFVAGSLVSCAYDLAAYFCPGTVCSKAPSNVPHITCPGAQDNNQDNVSPKLTLALCRAYII